MNVKITLSMLLLSTTVQLKSDDTNSDIMHDQISEQSKLQSLRKYINDYAVNPSVEKLTALHNYLYAYYPAIALIALQMIAVKYASRNLQATAAAPANNNAKQAPVVQQNALRAIIEILKKSAVPATIVATDVYLLRSANKTIQINEANAALAHQGLPTINAIIELNELEEKAQKLQQETAAIKDRISDIHSSHGQK